MRSRTSSEAHVTVGTPVHKAEGALVTFAISGGGDIVDIDLVGHGKMIDAPGTGGFVRGDTIVRNTDLESMPRVTGRIS